MDDADRPDPRTLLLLLGTVVAVFNLAGWTWVDYQMYGHLTTKGLQMGLFVMSASLALYLVLALALYVLGKESL